jgi:hypothetical protein
MPIYRAKTARYLTFFFNQLKLFESLSEVRLHLTFLYAPDKITKQKATLIIVRLAAAWSTMWNVTDETPGNSECFLQHGGMNYFLRCKEQFPNSIDLLRYV